MRLKDRIAIVTGAGQGIGEAAAYRFAEEGAKVIVSDISAETGEAVAAGIKAKGGDATFVAADVADLDAIKNLIAVTKDTYGGLDILHNNAGVHESAFTDNFVSTDLDEAVWDRVLTINLKAPWMLAKYATPLLAQSDHGVIVNAGSIGGLTAYTGSAAYGAAKAGLIHLTKVMALDLAPQGIRVNSYAPGNTDTPMVSKFYGDVPEDRKALIQAQLVGTHMFPRLALPREVADLVIFLASDESSAITGSNFVIDLGTLAWRGQNA
jgi:NAD(P)-dependent dehydrogenase (short-subunit alcohol dehydrogenase family)